MVAAAPVVEHVETAVMGRRERARAWFALRIAAVVVLSVLAVGGWVTPVAAHGGVVPQPVVTDLPDGLPNLEARGLVAYAPRISITNDDAQPLTVVDGTGQPWLRISSDGVFADQSVRAWSESLDATGRGQDPDPSLESSWTQVSELPTWEWFDTVLFPRTSQEDHEWAIPVIVDGQFDEIRGELRESPLEGRWATDLMGDGAVGGAQLTAISGSVPVFVVQRLEAEEIVVIGRHGEPMLRLTEAGFEVNPASPTWNDHARLDPNSPVGDVVEDPDAEPAWVMLLEDAPTATWVDVRAASPDIVPASRAATELTAEIPVIVDGDRHDVAVATTWIGDEVPRFTLSLPALVAASLGAGLLAAAAVRIWERRRGGTADGEAGATGSGDDPTMASTTAP